MIKHYMYSPFLLTEVSCAPGNYYSLHPAERIGCYTLLDDKSIHPTSCPRGLRCLMDSHRSWHNSTGPRNCHKPL